MSVNFYKTAKECFEKLEVIDVNYDEKYDDIQASIEANDGVICSCGRVVQSRYLKKHKRTQVHKDIFEINGLDIVDDDF